VFDVQSALTSPAAFGSRSDPAYNNLNCGIAQRYPISVYSILSTEKVGRIVSNHGRLQHPFQLTRGGSTNKPDQ
jgi:hypothetical protein